MKLRRLSDQLLWGILIGFFYNTSASYEDTLLFENIKFPVIMNLHMDQAIRIVPDIGCQVFDKRFLLTKEAAVVFAADPHVHVYKADQRTVDNMIILCEQYQSEKIDAAEFVAGLRYLSTFIIYPGTKWCGAGSSAENFTDLGVYTETDKCCRDHDSCVDYIRGRSCHERNGLCNRSPFTRSHCDCDEKFRQCLLGSNEIVSNMVGTLFFTVFGLKCFRLDFPIIQCEEYGGFLNIHCQKYTMLFNAEKMFQFFDNPVFTYPLTAEGLTNSSFQHELIA